MADLPSSGSDSEDEQRPTAEEAASKTKAALENTRVARLPPKKRKRANESGSDFSADSDASADSEEESQDQAASGSDSDVSVSALVRKPTEDTATLLLLRRMEASVEKKVLPLLSPHTASKFASCERGKRGLKLVEARFDAVVRALESMKPRKEPSKELPTDTVLDYMQRMVENTDKLYAFVSAFRNDTIRETDTLAKQLEGGVGDYASP